MSSLNFSLRQVDIKNFTTFGSMYLFLNISFEEEWLTSPRGPVFNPQPGRLSLWP